MEKVEYIFKSLYVRSEYVYVINYMNYFYLSPFPPIRLSDKVRPCVEERRKLDFKKQYFSIWQEVWTLHKKYFGVSANNEEAWQQLDVECEALDAKHKGRPEQKFLRSLLLAVCAELEERSKDEKK